MFSVDKKLGHMLMIRPGMFSHVFYLFLATCIAPLGMESGAISDSDISASSSFEHASVGPHNGR